MAGSLLDFRVLSGSKRFKRITGVNLLTLGFGFEAQADIREALPVLAIGGEAFKASDAFEPLR